MKYWRIGILPVISALMLVVLVACGAVEAPVAEGDEEEAGRVLTPVTFRNSWVVSPTLTPYTVGLAQGFYADEGIALEILEGSGAALGMTLVSQRENDFATGGFQNVVGAIQEGMDLVVVMNYFSQTDTGFLVLADSDVHSVEDLAGKRIAGTPGADSFSMGRAMLAGVGIDPDDDVEWVHVEPGADRAALLEGRVDSYSASMFTGPILLWYEDGIETRRFTPADAGLSILGRSIVVHRDMLEEDPELVGSFVRAHQRSIEWMLENPDEAAAIMQDRYPRTLEEDMIRDAIDVAAELVHNESTEGQPIGWISPEDAEESLQIFEEYFGLEIVRESDEYYTNQFFE